MGALTQLWLGTAPETEGAGGKYFSAYCRDFSRYADKRVWDEKVQDEVNNWCEKQIEKFEST